MRPFFPSLLSSWLSESPTSPRLTWYGEHSSRIELSGKVLATWVFKTSQALEDLAGATTGTRVLLDLPSHWRTLVWAVGTWSAGACVVLPQDGRTPGDAADADVVVTATPEAWTDVAAQGGVVLAQVLDDLALSWKGEPLRPGMIDAAAEVMTYPDQVDSVPIPLVADPALDTGESTIPFAALPTWASGHNQSRLMATTHGSAGNPARVLASTNSLTGLLTTALAVYGNRGSLVMVPPFMSDSARRDVAEQEATTEVW